MLNDWIHWLSLRTWDEFFCLLIGLFLLDGPRYCLLTTLMCLADWVRDTIRGTRFELEYTHCPTVCALIAGLNEADSIPATIESLIGSYPRLEIIVIDDGSTDGMTDAARPFARKYDNITVLNRPWRGGKSSALNYVLTHTKAEIIVAVDADSHVDTDSIWEIVQPFKDPTVGVVSATVSVRNAFTNLCTWFQAVEYTQSIFIGRRVSAKLGVLPIASGAFAGYRREVVERVHGFDVGPGEDLDLTLKIRKLGYRVEFAQYVTCHTEVPTRWKSLLKQRRRWDGDGPVRHLLRKHGDLTNPLLRHFSLSNFFTFWDSIVFNLLCGLGLLAWLIVMWIQGSLRAEPYVAFTLYAAAVAAEVLPLIALFYYSKTIRRDAILMLAVPIMPIYRLLLLFVRIYANLGEIFWRRSYYEPHVPPHVAEATWRY